MKISERSQKLAGVVEVEISQILQKKFTPNQVGFLTVSAVEVSGDLGVCDVFVRSFNGPKDFLKTMKKQEKYCSHLLTKSLNLRRNIIVRFKIDKAVETVKSIEEGLKKTEK